jgi:FlaA1/EpsC-like NDP-sugar epimerase
LDLSLSSAAFLLAYWVSDSHGILDLLGWEPYNALAVFAVANALIFYLFDLNKGIIRYTGFHELGRLLLVGFLSTLLLAILNLGIALFETPNHLLFWLGYFTFFVFSLGAYRAIVKYAYHHYFTGIKPNRKVAIYGAGDLGAASKAAIDQSPASLFHLTLFIDDNPRKHHKRLDGVPIGSFQDFARLHAKSAFDTVIVATKTADPDQRKLLLDFCLEHGINVLKSPPLESWPHKTFRLDQLQRIRIEDLLERQPIRIHKPELANHFAGKRVLVTGAAGSIGSELVRQILRHIPLSVIVCDQGETPLHDLLLELEPLCCGVDLQPYLASVTDEVRMNRLFQVYRPDYVFHAAAYKHVPMMERFPSEAVRVNTLGTQLMADLSIKWDVQRFVMVSTDKAVNPSNIMGASKRLAEIYVQGLSQVTEHHTRFITTRFGNVLGSNGSVVQRFQSQIESGGPLTVTHPEITRYFMLIPEACQLVLEASLMGKGGELFAFDMGQPVKIADMARKMIRLNGLQPDIDIALEFTGLRPGEKLYEEVLSAQEENLEPYHEKILIAKVRPVDLPVMHRHFSILDALLKDGVPERKLVAYMKNAIPEFISQNSAFEELDPIKVPPDPRPSHG